LKDTGSLPGGQQGKGLGIIHRDIGQVNVNAVVLVDNLFRLAQDGEVSQAQKVHFQQTNLGDISHGELGHHPAHQPCSLTEAGHTW